MIHALKSTPRADSIELSGCIDLVTLENLENYSELLSINFDCPIKNPYTAESLVYFTVVLTKEDTENVINHLEYRKIPEWLEICDALKEAM